MEKIIAMRHVTVTYQGKPALKDATIDFPAHQITSIIGPSGCGKTTLLHTINRMTEEIPGAKATGQILLSGKDVSTLPTEELRQRVGLVFQTPLPFPISILQNMSYVPRYRGIRKRAELEKIAREKLELVGLWEELDGDLHRNASSLSGGQQQRLCIARALTAEPEVLLLDEPCSALDVQSTQVIEQLLLRLRERYCVIIVTHNLSQARRISDQVVFLHNGRVIEYGTAEKLFTKPDKKETRDFLAGIFG